MRKKLIILVFCLATLISLPYAFAATGFTDWGFVTRVYAGYTSGYVYVDGLKEVDTNCTYDLIRFDPADGDPAKVEVLAMTAMLSGKKLRCNIDGCTSDGKYQRGKQCHLQD